eukprot:g67368.t1
MGSNSALSHGLAAYAGCSAGLLLDTGTSFIGVPKYDWDDFFELVTSRRPDCKYDKDKNEVRCSQLGSRHLPDLSFVFQDRSFRITGIDYMKPSGLLAFFRVDDMVPMYILGDAFLTNHYTIFDMEADRIGLANPPGLVSLTVAMLTQILLFFALLVGGCMGRVWLKHNKPEIYANIAGPAAEYAQACSDFCLSTWAGRPHHAPPVGPGRPIPLTDLRVTSRHNRGPDGMEDGPEEEDGAGATR